MLLATASIISCLVPRAALSRPIAVVLSTRKGESTYVRLLGTPDQIRSQGNGWQVEDGHRNGRSGSNAFLTCGGGDCVGGGV